MVLILETAVRIKLLFNHRVSNSEKTSASVLHNFWLFFQSPHSGLSAFLLFRLQCNEIIDKHILNNEKQMHNEAVGDGIQCFLKMPSSIKSALGVCDN